MRCHAFKKQTVYQLYNFSLFRVHNHFSIGAFVISEEPAVGNTNLTIGKTLSVSPGYIL